MPRLRAIALTCITAKNREQVGVIEFWGAQQPMVRCVSFLCSASESGVERVLCSPHPKLNPIRPITLDNGAHTRDIDIAIPFRLIWKTRPYIGQPWSSGRIPACQHKHGTRRRRIARALRSHVGYPRILENSWRRTSTTTRSRFSHEQYAGGTWTNPLDVESRDSSFRSWRPQNSHAECRTDGDASFRCKTDPGSIPGGCNKQRQTIWRRLFLPFFCTRTRRRYISCYVTYRDDDMYYIS